MVSFFGFFSTTDLRRNCAGSRGRLKKKKEPNTKKHGIPELIREVFTL